MHKKINELTSEIVKEYGLNAGASVVGIAAAKDFTLAPEGFKPSDNLEGCLSVVVLGGPISQEAILGDPVGFIDIRSALNVKMTDIANNVAKKIKADGYKVKAINGMGGKWVNGRQFGHISLKHAAELAGLGIIGRNYLLVNPQFGNLLWFSAVLTDAPLIPDKKMQNTICTCCNKCVEMCPSKALQTPALFGRKACEGTMFKRINNKWEIMCFICRKTCPHCFGTSAKSKKRSVKKV